MEIDGAQRPPEGATIIVPLADPPGSPPPGADGVTNLLSSHDASSERGSARLVQVEGRRVVVAGLGARDELEPDAVRDAAAAAVRELKATIGGAAAWLLDDSLPLPVDEQARAAVEGAVLGGYDPGAWKTGSRNGREVERLTLVGGPAMAPHFGKAKACILIFLYGSPPQHETFDPKLTAPDLRHTICPLAWRNHSTR